MGNLTNLEVLILFSNNLTGSIPSELGNLTNLTLFDLSDNILIGSIPSELGNLTNLTRFGLLKNLLSGNIPSELGNLTNLTTLWLYDNNLTGNIPPELGLLTNLTKFYLHNNELEGCFPDEINIFCSLGFNVIPSGDGYNLTNNPALPFQGDMEQWCNGTPQIGATCDDGNAATTNDVITATCGCEGVVPPCDPVSDSLALVALYNSTGGANWTNTWDLSQPMNTWFGVEVNSFGCVTCLDLDGNADCIFGGGGGNNGNNLNGILPDEIGNLVALEKLLISFNNQLVGEIPSTIVNLTSLKELYLALNSLTGSLPTSLGQISTLEKINIQSNQLTGNIPISIGDLSNLNFLALFNNQLSGELPSEIGNLQNLVRVNLGNNLLTGSIPTSIGNLSNLEALSLYANQLSGVIPTEIGNLSNLQELILMFNNLNGNIPSELGNLTNLTRIYIYNNELQGCFPIELNQFCSLGPNTNSNVDGYGFNNNPALPFQGDMEQWCNGTPQIGAPCDDGNAATVDDVITATCGCEGVVPPCDPVSDSLALVALYNSTDGANWTVTWDLNQPMSTWFGVEMNSFGCVTCLDLDGNVDCGNSLPTIGNNLVGGLPAELANLSQLEKLYLSENNISGNIPTAFGGLLNLERLDLANNNISGSIPDEIGALSNLVYLRLSTNNLSGSIPTSLGNLTGLFSLFLQENQLTGSIPTAFGNFQNLVSLNLSVNNLSGEIPQEILTINSLTQLWLVNNNFTGELPDVFSNNNSLITFHLGVNQFSGVLPISLSQVSSLTELKLFNNGFTGCFPNEYNVFCSIDYDFSNNPNLPDSGDFDAFCLNGTGSFIGNEINDILCSGESVIANGVTYDEATPTGTETIIGGAANGCDSVITVNLTFTNGASTGFADAGMDMSLCDNLATVMLTGSLPTNTTGQWTTTSGATIVNPNNANTDIADLQIGANEFFWSLSTVQCSNYDTDTVIVFYDIAEPDASDDTYTVFIEEPFNEDVIANDVLDNVSNWEANLLSTPAEGTLTFNLDGTFSYLPPNDYCGQVTFDYELCNLNCPGLCDIAKATINVIPETDTNLDAPNVITPNGDKFNEYLIIPKLFNDPSGFPNNKFVVFNQWGNVVFEMEDYQNDWNGVNKNGKELPQATYFYYFDDGQGDKVKGKVVILKE